jgi:hypothetical protein
MKSKQKSITGKIVWTDLETGFWSIVDSRYRKWRITNPPAALRHNGQSFGRSGRRGFFPVYDRQYRQSIVL